MNSTETLKKVWYKSILVRTALLSWVLIILTVLIFIIGTLPYQMMVIKDRMKSEANDIAGSIGQVTAAAIINDDYGFTVDHCLKIIKQSKSILYIIITRNDGFSLIHTSNGWKQSIIKDNLNLVPGKEVQNEIVYSKLVNQQVFHYSYPFSYSGIDWGRINIGLSLSNYNQNINNLYFRTVWLSLSAIFVGLFASVYFAKKLTHPIRQLDNVVQNIAGGDLSARVHIVSENEIGRLAQSFNKMTGFLQNSQDNLERKVEERTAELETINKVLQVQINERLAAVNSLKNYNLRLEALDKIYRGIIAAKSVDEIVRETINHLQKLFPAVSSISVDVYDFKTGEAIIFSKSFNGNISDPITRKILSFAESFKSVPGISSNNASENSKNSHKEMFFEEDLRFFLSAPLIMEEERIGTLNIYSDKKYPYTMEHKEVLNIVANQLAVAIYQAQLQMKINDHAQSLQNSLSEKEVLLKEIHHRVKNNLQVISSLLYLNSKKIVDIDALNMFKDSQNKIKSIALVHERLYQSKDLGNIDFGEYVQRLTTDLFRSFLVNPDVIKLEIDINGIFINIDIAVPCGLILNELISNSLKYAFPGCIEDRNGLIKISVKHAEDNQLILTVSDNGIGISKNSEEKKKNSLGLQLVETLVDQLEGTLEIDSGSGTSFRIKFNGK